MAGEENIQYHKWLKDDTVKVKLERGQKGAIGFEISTEAQSPEVAIARISETARLLKAEIAMGVYSDDIGGKG